MPATRTLNLAVVFLGCLLALTTSVAFANEQDELYKRFENSITQNNNSGQIWHDFSWMTPQMRAELIQYEYSKLNDPKEKQFLPPQDALSWLGDPATIQRDVARYRKANGAQVLLGPPDFLPYLISDLTNASDVNHVPLGFSLMDQSAKCCFLIICQWPAFPAATRDWAQRKGYSYGTHGSGRGAQENLLLRQWWAHNKEAILSRRYADATWLPADPAL